MFITFSENFFRALSAREFTVLGDDNKPLDASAYWAAQKVIGASLCIVHTLDCDHIDPARFRQYRGQFLPPLTKMLSRFHNIWVIYVLVSSEAESAAGSPEAIRAQAEAYDGQPLYEIFWRLRLDTGAVQVTEGQPTDMFGLRAALARSLPRASGPAAPGEPPARPGFSFRDAARRAEEESPFRLIRNKAVYTYILAAVNILVLFFFMDGFEFDYISAIQYGAIVPELIFYHHEYYRLLSAVFVHFGWPHLLMNLMGLFIFGTRVEKFLGYGRFLIIYLLSGLTGSVFSLFLTRGNAAGASGAVYGLTGAVFAYTLVAKRSMDRLTGYTMLLYAGIGLAMGFTSPGIDNFNHIGGWIAGAALGALLTRTLRVQRLTDRSINSM